MSLREDAISKAHKGTINTFVVGALISDQIWRLLISRFGVAYALTAEAQGGAEEILAPIT
jgi:hypothetical protein